LSDDPRLDHDVQNESDQNLRKYRLIEEFANTHGIDFCMLAALRRNFPKHSPDLGQILPRLELATK
jgi:hypothetical protein